MKKKLLIIAGVVVGLFVAAMCAIEAWGLAAFDDEYPYYD